MTSQKEAKNYSESYFISTSWNGKNPEERFCFVGNKFWMYFKENDKKHLFKVQKGTSQKEAKNSSECYFFSMSLKWNK